ARAVSMIAASDAFMSYAPRPYTRPEETDGVNGAAIPPAPTVSMCAFSIKDEPPPEPRKTPTTEGRPATGSTTETSRPASRSHDATNPAIAASPPPDGTRSGFTDGIATSAQISSSSSSRTVHPKHMQTIEREAEPTPAAKPTGPRQFQPKEIFKQAVISSLAVAPDASSIVYVKRTVDDGKYVRRLWRTTFKGGRPDQ